MSEKKQTGIDKHNQLDKLPFSCSSTKNGIVFINYFHKQVKILKGKEAEQFLKKMEAAADEKAKQLIMAKITGNFKRGNEKG
ncbi:hypothetical protein [Metabacillus indicus]|uniref:hypothetical protein n=1 Tax=Metabacillus indicus TaxID=246786 RepID=UPI00049322DD|nr:hypothetical protein [Metabacillus indicus]KEZ50510.1 hypothetical protein AZ46_0207530 [Metabacillus indicus LMG 22858]